MSARYMQLMKEGKHYKLAVSLSRNDIWDWLHNRPMPCIYQPEDDGYVVAQISRGMLIVDEESFITVAT